jgi:hypothetical protein
LFLLFSSRWLGQFLTALIHYLLSGSLNLSQTTPPLTIETVSFHFSFDHLDILLHHLRWKNPFHSPLPLSSKDFLFVETIQITLSPRNLFSLIRSLGSSSTNSSSSSAAAAATATLHITSLIINKIDISLEYDLDRKEYNFNALMEEFTLKDSPTQTSGDDIDVCLDQPDSNQLPEKQNVRQSSSSPSLLYDIHSFTITSFHLHLKNILTTSQVNLTTSHVFFSHHNLHKHSTFSTPLSWVSYGSLGTSEREEENEKMNMISETALTINELLHKIIEKLIVQLLITNKRRTIQFLSSAGAHQLMTFLSKLLKGIPRWDQKENL